MMIIASANISTAAGRVALRTSLQRTPVEETAGWVVVFAGARDSYQVPVALYEAGLLRTLVTDFYSPLDNSFTAAACRLLPSSISSKLRRRFHPALPSQKVKSHWAYAIKNWSRPNAWQQRVHGLGGIAGRLAAKERCPILAYSHLATAAFDHASTRPKVLMQMQPHPAAVRRALACDNFLPEFEHQGGNELTWPAAVFDTFSQEPLRADQCIVASNYTRATLIESGVSHDRVTVIPYGVDLDFFAADEKARDKFTVLFVGQLSRQKGLHYLLEAWRRLNLPNSELRIAGEPPCGSRTVANYGSYASFLGHLDWAMLRNEYRRADLLCLPSLSDGFGLTVLEAMACGLPALVTSACGASDLIREGENGFVIPAADLESLMSKLEWASRHRDVLREMQTAARSTAEQYSWARFRDHLAKTLARLEFAS